MGIACWKNKHTSDKAWYSPSVSQAPFPVLWTELSTEPEQKHHSKFYPEKMVLFQNGFVLIFHKQQNQYFIPNLIATWLTFLWYPSSTLIKLDAQARYLSSEIKKNTSIGDELMLCLQGVNRTDKGEKKNRPSQGSLQAHLWWTDSAPWAHFSDFAKMLSENPWSSSLQTP